jgi:hypothetical protein
VDGDLFSSIVGLLWVVSSLRAMGLVIATSLTGAAVILTTHPRKADALETGRPG